MRRLYDEIAVGTIRTLIRGSRHRRFVVGRATVRPAFNVDAEIAVW
jgi:hypothetical protein